MVVNNYNNWCLRADTPDDRMHWVEVLQLYKEDSASTDTTSLRRHGSTMSLQSNTVSVASGSSLKKTQRSLKEKVGEIETFKDILFGQIETLQRYVEIVYYFHIKIISFKCFFFFSFLFVSFNFAFKGILMLALMLIETLASHSIWAMVLNLLILKYFLFFFTFVCQKSSYE